MVGNGENFNFDNINVDDTIRVMFKIDTRNVVYSLIFTTLPTVLIFTEEDIVDEPKIYSEFIINDILDGKIYDIHAGIENRGGPSSQNSPKKSYDLELWEEGPPLFSIPAWISYILPSNISLIINSEYILGSSTISSSVNINTVGSVVNIKLYTTFLVSILNITRIVSSTLILSKLKFSPLPTIISLR
jgi:hypothetical protein